MLLIKSKYKIAKRLGAAVFEKIGCDQCHIPTLKATDATAVIAFTDLLLHDMGPELDDGVGEPGVASSEWRTAAIRNRYPGSAGGLYLHDGSAASVGAAVEKHGGEAARARDAFRKLGIEDRDRLINYVSGK